MTPSGEVETVQHFLVRIQAQQQTLKLSRGLGCQSNPGFPPFGDQVRKALAEIAIILSYYNGHKEPASDQSAQRGGEFSEVLTPAPLLPTYLPGSGRGVGEEGLLPAPEQPSGPKPKGAAPPKPSPPPPAGAQPGAQGIPTTPVETPQETPEDPRAALIPEFPDVKGTVGKVIGQAEESICTAIREVHELC